MKMPLVNKAYLTKVANLEHLARFFPFLRWYPINERTFKADAIAGVTVALVLIPQAMAYAQLAGLPPYYGLYASFLPVIVGALWGSSGQLATGPVAVVSLLTASALSPLAGVGSQQFIAFAMLLALMVGSVQLALGVFKLGVIINFLSHPVIVGFTNAAALIIGLSQLNKLLGVSLDRSEHFLGDIWGVLKQTQDTHIPTLLMGLTAFAIIWWFRKYRPKLPGILIAVMVTTFLSWVTNFERNENGDIDQIADGEARELATDIVADEIRAKQILNQINERSAELRRLHENQAESNPHVIAINYGVELLKMNLRDVEKVNLARQRALRKMVFELVPNGSNASGTLYLLGKAPPDSKTDGRHWRIRSIAEGKTMLVGGGAVVGSIPSGLPSIKVPVFDWDTISTLFASALVISLVGFMEAISIAKAIATKTKKRLDPNQELIGQGLANITASFSQAYPVSGSFSRSAVNINAGAETGMSSVVTGLLVAFTLLFLTPLLYHLPQSVLAAIIIAAVIGLINFKAMKHAWQAHRHDGIASVLTFVATLGFAPHLDNGILAGAALALVLYLFRTMQPRVVVLSRHADGTLRDARLFNLETSEHIVAVRFDGSLYFANVPYFEDAILGAAANNPKAKYILVVGDGINEVDASGEESIRQLVMRLRDRGVTVVFSGLKRQVLMIFENTGLYGEIGAQDFYRTEEQALDAVYERINDPTFDLRHCPLKRKDQPLASMAT